MRYDLWFALRRLSLRPMHSAVVALTLGLGMGAALAVFAVVDAVLLHPLPYADPSRIVRVTQTIPVRGLPEISFSDVGYRRLASDSRSLIAAAAYNTRDVNLIGRGAPRRLTTAQVTASLFDVLRVRPAIGRAFRADEDVPGAGRVVVLSDALWRSAFGARTDVVGTTANLDGEPFIIIGVLDATTTFPGRGIDAWEPLRLDPVATNPFGRSYEVVARLAPNVTFDQARADLVVPIRAVGREFPGPHAGSALDEAGFQAKVRWLGEAVVGDTRPVILLLLGGVTLLLLLTCANVANLQLAAALARGEELAVRAALGATRGRLVLGALFEGIVLSSIGGIIGVAIAVAGSRVLALLMPAGVALNGSLVGGRVVIATVVIVVIVGALAGALPVAAASGRDAALALRDRVAGRFGVGSRRVRRLLASTQVAFAVMLLHGSGLLIASAGAVQSVRLGFKPDSTMSLLFNLAAEKLRDRATRETLLRRLLAEAQSTPGVTSAALANALPLTPGRRDLAMALEGRPFRADGTDPLADYRVVSAQYFSTMGIPVRRGRTFTDDDATASYTPVVISEGLAKEIWGDDTDPVGHRLRFGPGAPWMPIIGVVGDATNRSLTEAPRPELYLPALGTYANLALRSEIALVVRTAASPASVVTSLRRAVASVDPEVPMYDIASMREIVDASRARMTTVTRLMSAYATAALLLAIAGTYAVLSYLVAQRRRELGVRIALGASPFRIVSLVARESAVMIGAGIAAGLVSALALTRLLSGLLFGVGTLDPRVIAAVIGVTGVAGIGAALLPARRAARVDPCDALRDG